MQLAGKGAIVTGAGSGIGEAIADTFASQGAEVVTVGRTASKLEEAKERAGDAGARIHPYAADISDRPAIAAMAKWAADKLGKVDILVNNAGMNVPNRSFANVDPDDFEKVVQVNLNGPFYCIHEVLPGMGERGDGLIINVSSTAGVRAAEVAGVPYNASKFGMSALSLSIGLEERDNGIRACLICPGEVNTPILDNRPVVPDAERRAKMLQPEDLAQAALMVACLHPRACIPMMVVTPTMQRFA